MNNKLKQLHRFWYFSNSFRKLLSEVKSYDILDVWINIWFAKNEKQAPIDEYLKLFEPLLGEFINYETDNIYELVTLIVLYDQIPRNIYRGTPAAYEYDYIANNYIKQLLPYFDDLHLIFKLTIIIGLVHSEDLDDQNINIELLKKIKKNRLCSNELYLTVKQITINHRERIELFGRIPERNIILNRRSTPEELSYMNAM